MKSIIHEVYNKKPIRKHVVIKKPVIKKPVIKKSVVKEKKKVSLYDKKLTHGVDPFYDIHNRLPNVKLITIFDVGANVGQTIKKIIPLFPKCNLYSFEPIKETYEILCKKYKQKDYPNIKIINKAFGDIEQQSIICFKKRSGLSCIVDKSYTLTNSDNKLVNINVDIIDNFCIKNNIKKINYLKIDTEGYDLNVLIGSENMLNNQTIDIIQVEVGVSNTNTKHIKFETIFNYLQNKNYFLFGIYDQVYEFILKFPYLRRINAVFISKNVSMENRIS